MKSKNESLSFKTAVENALNGQWVLPAFQRDLKWKRNQNILLFDSLRSGYPVGTLLCAKAGALTKHRLFEHCNAEDSEDFEYFVLDGQQRISAGIQLLYADKTDQKSHYFVDLNRLNALLNEHKQSVTNFDVYNEDHIKNFEEEMLDADSGYVVPKTNIKHPHLEFEKKGLVWTALLRQTNSKKYETHRDSYIKANSDDKSELIELFRQTIKDKDIYNLSVPVIAVDTKDPKVLTRIFTTLNNTGTSLTPFEITVSEMYGQGINLVDEIDKIAAPKDFYPQMDKDRTMLLQACVLRGSKQNHKKTNLPKTLNKEIWEKNSAICAQSIDDLGSFLTKKMGVGLNKSSNYIPYDTALLPLTHLFDRCDRAKMNTKEETFFEKIVNLYFVGSALKLHFTEGAASKQAQDKDTLYNAWEKQDTDLVLDIFSGKSFPGFQEVTNSGARGRVTICIQNARGLTDVISATSVSVSGSHELHHIFPKAFFKKQKGKTKISINHIANLMLTHDATNKTFSGLDPYQQVDLARQHNSNYEEHYATHFIDKNGLKILEEKSPTLDNYYKFIEARSSNLESYIHKQYGITANNNQDQSDVDVEEVSD